MEDVGMNLRFMRISVVVARAYWVHQISRVPGIGKWVLERDIPRIGISNHME
jgi:hypothetical protein